MPASTVNAGPQGEGDTGSRAAAAITLGALGVVFGDIGTSPLYSLSSVFAIYGVQPVPADVYGLISLVVWAIVLVVTVKYVAIVMRADNQGEGGIMALVALVSRMSGPDRRIKTALVAFGVLGVALFFGDGTVTPAISVISSVEGLKVAVPGISSLVVPITVALLTLLFVAQQLGTQAIGRLFGPIMAVWFVLLAVTGTAKIIPSPGILRSLSPSFGASFFIDHPQVGFLSLGAVVLVVTGAEALYADLGQFSRSSIRRAWFLIVFPALLLNYLGQGALILANPNVIKTTPFFELLPKWALVPMVVVAVLATMIASQAVITGAFSVARQAMRLGFLPRLRIRHRSSAEGQIYVPAVNRLLYVAVIGLVIGFGSSSALASAYGIAVTGTFTITTVLLLSIAHVRWHRPLRLVLPLGGLFLIVDLAFFSANLTKVPSGGWFPLTLGLVMFTVLMTWRRGSAIVTAKRTKAEGLLSDFIDEITDMRPGPYRAPGTAICLSAGKRTTPLALRDNLEYNNVLHERVIIVSVDTASIPHIEVSERAAVEDLDYLGDDITYVTIQFGFQDKPDVPRALERMSKDGLLEDVGFAAAVYLVSEIELTRATQPGLSRWRRNLFLMLARTASNPIDSFHLPNQRVVTVGTYIEI